MKAHCIKVLLVLIILFPYSVMAKPAELPNLEGSFLEIPWSDFKKILEKLQLPEPPPEPEEEEPLPPMPYAITSANYEGEMASGAAGFDLTIKFTVLEKKEWLVVPILPADLAVEDIKLDRGPVLVITRDGWHKIVLHSPGPHIVTGRFFVKPQNRLGPSSIAFPLPKTPVTNLIFSIPEPGLTITANPASLNRVDNKENASILTAVLQSTDRVTISWGRKVDAEEAELRLNAVVESLVSLGERLCRVKSLVRYEILHRGVTKFRLALPLEVAVVDVSGRGVVDWKVRKNNKRQVVTVNLNYEAKGSYDLYIDYEKSLPDATAEAFVPELEVLDTGRDIGYLGVAARTNIEVEINSLNNLASMDVSKLPSGIAGRSPVPLIFAFKYIGHPWELKLQVTKHKEVEILTCTVDSATLHSFLTSEGVLITRAVYTVRNNREQFIRISLPKGARVFNTFRGNMPVQPAGDKKGRILIPLEKSTGASGQAKSFTIEITYLVQLPELSKFYGKLNLTAPETDIMTNEMEWVMYLPKDYKYKVDETTLEESKRKSVSLTSVLKINEQADTSTLHLQGESGRRDWNGYQVGGNVQLDQKSIIRAALPVRFTVPQDGVPLNFHKTILKEKESNSVGLTYRKVLKLTTETRWIVTLVTFLLITLVVYRILVRLRRGRKKTEEEIGQ